MRTNIGWVVGAGLGAGAAYLLDGTSGGRRRALIRDKALHGTRLLRDAAGATTRDLSHRAAGAIARAKQLVPSGDVPDSVLVERARAALGRVVSHPHAIDVGVRDGCLVLSGPVLAAEVQPLIDRLSRVRGVRGIDNLLEVHDSPGNVPSLQGAARTSADGRGWSPATRFAAGLTAAAVAFWAASRARRRAIDQRRLSPSIET